jgi:glycine hydroxymethyltransferase
MQGGPLEHVIAAKAVCFKEAMAPEFKVYQSQIRKNAVALAEGLKELGFRLVAGGTDNHLMMIDVFAMGLTGKPAQTALDLAGIVQNRNMIPFDTQKPYFTSGIRLGTPAVTTRGMKEPQMRLISRWMAEILTARDPAAAGAALRPRVVELCEEFPMHRA